MDTKFVALFVIVVIFVVWFVSHIKTKQIIEKFDQTIDEQKLWNSLTEIQKITVQRTCDHAQTEEERAETFSDLVQVLAKQNQHKNHNT